MRETGWHSLRFNAIGSGLVAGIFLLLIGGCATAPGLSSTGPASADTGAAEATPLASPDLGAEMTTAAPAPIPDPNLEPQQGEAPIDAPEMVEVETMPQWVLRGPALAYLDDTAIAAPLHHDIWDRIREGLSIDPEAAKHARVEVELRWFVRHPEYLQRVFERAEPFLHFIVETLEEYDLPTDLALLPIVESAFQPFAYSHGRAAGIWQFIPSTGRLYGLKQNWWYDGRRDIGASTVAAARHLADLGKRFDGDWLKALAAYNAGSGNVSRAVRRNERKDRPTDFWSLDLPRETQGYVPKLLALNRIIAAPALYGIDLHSIADEPVLATVDTGGQIDLALAAELAGLSLEELYLHNAGFNRWATDPDGPHQLLLPIDAAAELARNLEQVPADRRITWKRHKVGQGETLSQIARRYRTTVDQLREVNSLRSHIIRAGHHLLIPVASQGFDDYSLSAQQRQRSIQSRNRQGERIEHTLRSGETLWSLSRRYGVTTRQIAAWNGMAPRDLVHPGQKLVIWVDKQEGHAQESRAQASRVAFSGNEELNGHMLRTIRYTVRKGESLALIAGKFNVTVSDLKRWNQDAARSKYLQPGQVLRIKVDVRRQSG